MQQQPHLIDLGLARLKIFEHFCLPTIVQQTSQDFVWIIRTDPELDERLKQPLLELLRDYPNYFVVASNVNPEGFRHIQSMSDITEASVWVGDLKQLRNFHAAAQSRIVLESRLDADDGLHTSFVDYMQRTAPVYIPHPYSWTIWCASKHLEWHYSSPFSSKHDVDEGFWIGIKQTGCVTPGLTMVYGKDVNREDLPKGTHHVLHKVTDACKHDQDDHCLRRFEDLMPGAIRVRTPTSAGMGNVLVGKHGQRKIYKKAEKEVDLQSEMWTGVKKVFCVSIVNAKIVRDYIKVHLQAIAADNLKGQCTKGHSCKESSIGILKLIMTDESLAK
jgi:Putative rhamnosyl transferase